MSRRMAFTASRQSAGTAAVSSWAAKRQARRRRGSGAFAAELLAPADGIRRILNELDSSDDSALEAVARHFEVSPLLVRYQYDNQLTGLSR